jgi:hypothetical protein
MKPVDREREAIRKRFPDEYRDGYRVAFLQEHKGDRERGAYPRGFHAWPLDRRNTWFAGANHGHHDRLAEVAK